MGAPPATSGQLNISLTFFAPSSPDRTVSWYHQPLTARAHLGDRVPVIPPPTNNPPRDLVCYPFAQGPSPPRRSSTLSTALQQAWAILDLAVVPAVGLGHGDAPIQLRWDEALCSRSHCVAIELFTALSSGVGGSWALPFPKSYRTFMQMR